MAQPAWQGVPHRQDQRGDVVRQLQHSQHHPLLHPRRRGRPTRPWSTCWGGSRRASTPPRPRSRWPGCSPRSPGSCRSPAPSSGAPGREPWASRPQVDRRQPQRDRKRCRAGPGAGSPLPRAPPATWEGTGGQGIHGVDSGPAGRQGQQRHPGGGGVELRYGRRAWLLVRPRADEGVRPSACLLSGIGSSWDRCSASGLGRLPRSRLTAARAPVGAILNPSPDQRGLRAMGA